MKVKNREILAAIADESGLSEEQVHSVLEALKSVIQRICADAPRTGGVEIFLTGLMKLKAVVEAPQNIRLPSGDGYKQVKERVRIRISPSTALKNRVNSARLEKETATCASK